MNHEDFYRLPQQWTGQNSDGKAKQAKISNVDFCCCETSFFILPGSVSTSRHIAQVKKRQGLAFLSLRIRSYYYFLPFIIKIAVSLILWS